MRVTNRIVIGTLIGLCALAVLCAAPAHAQTFTFGVSGTSTDGKSIAPTVTWATSPAATSCTASATPAKSDWLGSKTGSGSSILTAVTATTTFELVCTWPGNTTAVVTWQKPTTNSDGTPITGLAGFRVQWGQASGDANMSQTVYLSDPARTSWTSPALAAGPWFFGVKAFNAQGIESDLSNIATKTLSAAQSLTRSAKIQIDKPNAPANVGVQ